MFILVMINIAITCVCVYHTMAVREELKMYDKHRTKEDYGMVIEKPMNEDINPDKWII